VGSGIRITPKPEKGSNRTVTFVMAIGSTRQTCRLTTNFYTRHQALSYLHKHRIRLEHVARMQFARGQIENGVVELTMFR
jgi:hypothetical protein